MEVEDSINFAAVGQPTCRRSSSAEVKYFDRASVPMTARAGACAFKYLTNGASRAAADEAAR